MVDKILKGWDKEKINRKKKDKSLSLHPLTFDKALNKLLPAKPEKPKKKKAGMKTNPPLK
jgi:hypothetical protein